LRRAAFIDWIRSKLKPGSTVYADLRARALAVSDADIGTSVERKADALFGLLMEFCAGDARVSLVVMADGSTSLYFSNGGGQLGLGLIPTVASVAARLLASADELRAQMQLTTAFPTAAAGRVRFFLMTSGGVLTAEEDDASLRRGSGRFSALFQRADEVITEIRIASEFPPMVVDFSTQPRHPPIESAGAPSFFDVTFQGKSTPIVHDLEKIFPALQESAREFLDCMGREFSHGGHLETDVAAAATVSGSVVLRATGIDLHAYSPGSVVLREIHQGEDAILRFMAGAALGGGLGVPRKWNEPIPAAHKSKFKPAEMVQALESSFERICEHSSVPPAFYAHIAGLTAIRLVQAGDRLKILNQALGINIAFQYVAVGCRTIPLRGSSR
jgi:hypothetical protein